MQDRSAISPRRMVPAIGIVCVALTSWGVAHASFPPSTPTVAEAFALSGSGQDVAVNTTTNIIYSVSTQPDQVTAFDPVLGIPIATMGVRFDSFAIDVNSRTGTVYVPDGFAKVLQVMPGDLSTRIDHPLPLSADNVAVHPADDTVYVSYTFNNALGILNGNNLDDSVTISVGYRPLASAVNPMDDTIYVTSSMRQEMYIIEGNGNSVQTVSLAAQNLFPSAVAVHPTDGTVYIGGALRAALFIAPADLSTFEEIPLPESTGGIRGLSVSPDGSTLWAATQDNLGRSMAFDTADVDDSYSFAVGPSSFAVSATDRFAAILDNTPAKVSMVAWPGAATSVVPAQSPEEGGVAVTITGSGFIPGVTTVRVGGVPLGSAQVHNSTTITGVLPAQPAGPADVVISTWALTATLAGAVSYLGPPPPPAPVPASAPRDVAAQAGDGSAVVSWMAPESSGSFPVSMYQVRSNPGGAGCLVVVSQTSCEVTGLTNDVAYSFEVRALSGAGWGPWSAVSNAVTPGPQPVPSILISGTRGEVRGGTGIVVSGTSEGFGMGAMVRPWVRVEGRSSFTEGSARILVDTDGAFTWQRRGAKTMTVYVATPDGSLASNRITISRSGA